MLTVGSASANLHRPPTRVLARICASSPLLQYSGRTALSLRPECGIPVMRKLYHQLHSVAWHKEREQTTAAESGRPETNSDEISEYLQRLGLHNACCGSTFNRRQNRLGKIQSLHGVLGTRT
jgi:hypothetical protein